MTVSHATLALPPGLGALANLTPAQRIFFGYLADYTGATRNL
jgi:hypothetical protein